MAIGARETETFGRRRLATALGLALAILAGAAGASPVAGPDSGESVKGLLLVAAPGMPDPRFAETVIYMVEHDREGAFGLVVNRLILAQDFATFLGEIGVEVDDPPGGRILLHGGGPVDMGSGFVLHTADYADPATVEIDGRFALTVGRAIFRAIAEGNGPRSYLVAFGYAGWGPGQLDAEMAREDWVTAGAAEAILFDGDYASKWRRAFDAHGISL